MSEFLRLIGIAMVLSALTLPLAWCQINDDKGRMALKIECLKAGGEIQWGECDLP